MVNLAVVWQYGAHAERRRQRAPHPHGRRHADGRAVPPLLAAGAPVPGAARARRPARPREGPRRRPRRLPRHRRPRRPRSIPCARTAAPISSSGATRSAASAAPTTAGSSTWRPLRRHADDAAESRFRDKVRAGAYPTREWGDFVWAYLGPAGHEPPLPEIEFAVLPPSHRFVSKKLQQCNWAQACEGAIDTAHFSFLHMPVWSADDGIEAAVAPLVGRRERTRWMRDDPRPRVRRGRRTTSGFVAGAARKADGNDLYWRIAQFMLPNHALTPNALPGREHPRPDLGPDHRRAAAGCSAPRGIPTGRSPTRSARIPRGPQRARRGRRALGAGPQSRQRLPDRPRRSEAAHVHRHPGRVRAGRHDPGQPGPDRRPHARAPRADGHRDHRVPQADPARRARARAGTEPAAARDAAGYRVRGGSIVADRGLSFAETMVERFGDPSGDAADRNRGPVECEPHDEQAHEAASAAHGSRRRGRRASRRDREASLAREARPDRPEPASGASHPRASSTTSSRRWVRARRPARWARTSPRAASTCSRCRRARAPSGRQRRRRGHRAPQPVRELDGIQPG